MKRIALLLLPAFVWAADPAAVVYWNSNDLKGYERTLKPKMNAGKVASETLNEFGTHLTMIAHREGDGEAEVHDHMADFFVVQSGNATLVTGGKVEGGKTTAPGEIRAPKINGASGASFRSATSSTSLPRLLTNCWWRTGSSLRISSSK